MRKIFARKTAFNKLLNVILKYSNNEAIRKCGLLHAQWKYIKVDTICRVCYSKIEADTLLLGASRLNESNKEIMTHICEECSAGEIDKLKRVNEELYEYKIASSND